MNHWERQQLYGQLEDCETDVDDSRASCLWCHDSGVDPINDRACPECEMGQWNNITELWDDARQGR